jgi:hypothetical protein
MIDVVYTLGTESKCEDLELRYSLRSLSLFKDLGKVFIVGHLPKWIKRDTVIHIPAFDPYLANKDANLISKLILACFDERLSEDFLWFSDDQVLLRECDVNLFQTPLIDNIHLRRLIVPGARLNRWLTRLKRSKEILIERGYKYDCYESHTPYLLNKKLYPKILLSYDYGSAEGYLGNTLYFNTLFDTLDMSGIENTEQRLMKLEVEHSSVQEIELKRNSKFFLNYTDRAINKNLFVFLETLFPETSIFE